MQLTEHRFATWDGTTLFYRAWTPASHTKPTRAVLLFHRGHEHSGRWDALARSLDLDDAAVYAWDQRGHGQSDGERGCAPGLAAVVRDADCFARRLEQTHGVVLTNTVVIASSLGAVVATAWIHDYAPPVRALVLAAPAFAVKLYVPMAIPFLRARERLLPGGKVKSFVRASMLTGDPTEQQAYVADTKIFPQIAVDMLLDLHDAGRRLVADAGAVTTPTLMLAAGRDWVVKRGPQELFYRRLGSPVKQFEQFDDGRHALFHDTVTPRVLAVLRTFIGRRFAAEESSNVTRADLGGPSRTEYDLLRTPSGLFWRVLAQVVRVGGLFSRGIALGFQTGFDSGQSLDYVYENRAAGRLGIGRIIDRGYLNAIGWRGIRVRRTHLRELLRIAIDRVTESGRRVHLLDVAAGPGRYVLETLQDPACRQVTAELRDYRQANLDAAGTLATSLGVADRATFKLSDAFDRAALAAATPKPSIVIASGLYELFPCNDAVRQSLAGIGDAIDDDGLLVYTNQPWHPQVEFIARALVNREGKPWIMRRRSQAEMDALVRAAGFEKVAQRIDRWGIFTVSFARRLRR